MSTDSEHRLVLVSASPRRRRLLSWLGLPFDVASVDTAESLDTPLASDPAALAVSLAEEKADAAATLRIDPGSLVLTFDTIVVLDREVLGKPRDQQDAWRMLRALSGRTHQVVTGVGLTCPETGARRMFAVSTDVQMKSLDDARIAEWMSGGEYLGCAGAYNIEAQVAEVGTCACYQNVAGMPLCHLHAALRDPGFDHATEPASPIAACDAALGRSCELGPRVIGAD